ncbi:hypothetical protein LINGRAHAP2_LOCUS31692 [Linum grandiflorum]
MEVVVKACASGRLSPQLPSSEAR